MKQNNYLDFLTKISTPIIISCTVLGLSYNFFIKPTLANDFIEKTFFEKELDAIREEYRGHIKDIKDDMKAVRNSNNKIYQILLQMKGNI
jgi:hypothetical protein